MIQFTPAQWAEFDRLESPREAAQKVTHSLAAKMEALIMAGLQALLGEVDMQRLISQRRVSVRNYRFRFEDDPEQLLWVEYSLDAEPFFVWNDKRPASTTDYNAASLAYTVTFGFHYRYLGRCNHLNAA